MSTTASISLCQGPKQITDDGRITFEVKDGEAILTCKSAEKGDAGKSINLLIYLFLIILCFIYLLRFHT